MRRFWSVLKFVGILVGIVFVVTVMFIEILDLMVPGDFPDWVYVVEMDVWAVVGVFYLVMLIKEGSKRSKAKKYKKN